MIAIDLRELTFVGSAGIAAILEPSQRSPQRGCRLIVVSADHAFQRAFAVCGLTDSLPFVAALPPRSATRARIGSTHLRLTAR